MPTTTGYDLRAEQARLRFPDLTLRGVTLNRATARIQLTGRMERGEAETTRATARGALFTTTHDAKGPVLELGWPVAGPYVASPAGTYMDLYLGVAQKILDENHPRLVEVAEALMRHKLLFRREIATDDFLLVSGNLAPVAGPIELGVLLDGLAAKRWPEAGGYRTFHSNSGTEACEAALKLAFVVKYKKFLEKRGLATFQRLMAQLKVPEVAYFAGKSDTPVFSTYPFVVVACESSFHGRTLGSLHATRSKAAHQFGYPKAGNVRHIPYNSGDSLAGKIDPRPIEAILDAPGGVGAVLESGRIPADLFAGFLAEPLQGEGGYVPGDPAFFQACEAACRAHDALFMLDEVQTFGRTGTLFLSEQLDVTPDAICIAKAAVVGATIARADLERFLHVGWHSNTFGGGKLFDTSFAYAVVDTLANERNPMFAGLSYPENCAVKGDYLAQKLEEIAARHPKMVLGQEGRGLLCGVDVRQRDKVIAEGWKRGLKMLGCGPAGEVARIRLIFLADTLAREIDDFAKVFEETVAAVGG
ncbi:MAG: aminotransferase class III-fold pyridoxal phosphate-dependent enzyme [Planctomycetaceae bacterium]